MQREFLIRNHGYIYCHLKDNPGKDDSNRTVQISVYIFKSYPKGISDRSKKTLKKNTRFLASYRPDLYLCGHLFI